MATRILLDYLLFTSMNFYILTCVILLLCASISLIPNVVRHSKIKFIFAWVSISAALLFGIVGLWHDPRAVRSGSSHSPSKIESQKPELGKSLTHRDTLVDWNATIVSEKAHYKEILHSKIKPESPSEFAMIGVARLDQRMIEDLSGDNKLIYLSSFKKYYLWWSIALFRAEYHSLIRNYDSDSGPKLDKVLRDRLELHNSLFGNNVSDAILVSLLKNRSESSWTVDIAPLGWTMLNDLEGAQNYVNATRNVQWLNAAFAFDDYIGYSNRDEKAIKEVRAKIIADTK